jgi:hypothetical protein
VKGKLQLSGWRAEPLNLASGPPKTGADSFLNHCALELGKHALCEIAPYGGREREALRLKTVRRQLTGLMRAAFIISHHLSISDGATPGLRPDGNRRFSDLGLDIPSTDQRRP